MNLKITFKTFLATENLIQTSVQNPGRMTEKKAVESSGNGKESHVIQILTPSSQNNTSLLSNPNIVSD